MKVSGESMPTQAKARTPGESHLDHCGSEAGSGAFRAKGTKRAATRLPKAAPTKPQTNPGMMAVRLTSKVIHMRPLRVISAKEVGAPKAAERAPNESTHPATNTATTPARSPFLTAIPKAISRYFKSSGKINAEASPANPAANNNANTWPWGAIESGHDLHRAPEQPATTPTAVPTMLARSRAPVDKSVSEVLCMPQGGPWLNTTFMRNTQVFGSMFGTKSTGAFRK